MALHQIVQRLILIGARMHHQHEAPPEPRPPPQLAPLIAAFAPVHRSFDRRAIDFGHRYRSGYWAIYLLSAVAVLLAMLPLALGWDSPLHRLHPFAGVWALNEVLLIGVVSMIYWRGNSRDWQGQWLRARTTAELTWYLPMLAPLLDFSTPGGEPNWYLRIFDPGKHLRTVDDIARLCEQQEAATHELVAQAWADPSFVSHYARWSIEILAQQQHYHRGVAARQHALLHRVHLISGYLFGLTAVGAVLHLIVHTLWLSLVTTFFPALGASLHGALAQSEAYRLQAASNRLVDELGDAIERITRALASLGAASPDAALRTIKASIEGAIALILEEHQDWNLLVRPHQLPLG